MGTDGAPMIGRKGFQVDLSFVSEGIVKALPAEPIAFLRSSVDVPSNPWAQKTLIA